MSGEKKVNTKEFDRQIVRAISKGEYSVLNEVYEHYFPAIRYMVLQNNGSQDAAKDIFQEAVLLLYDKIKKGDFVLKSKLQTYLYAVCRNIWLKQLRDQNTAYNTSDITEFENELVDENATEEDNRQEEFERMESALNKLGNPCRGILTHFYIKGKSMKEISEYFGYTNASNAKNQKYKCLQRLKKHFFNPSSE
ncbi:MAG TPA: sigma-70 family RNA polymerase sigma factor [Sphingobacterium sp.]|nr:sigma-70 family RNA polymerase sigma factor [Sphingobacterium sp.]